MIGRAHGSNLTEISSSCADSGLTSASNRVTASAKAIESNGPAAALWTGRRNDPPH
jgi:hypothetical protein